MSLNTSVSASSRSDVLLNNSYLVSLPLEGLHHVTQRALQVQDLLHQETLDGRLLAARGVDPLGRLPPHQDLMLQLCMNTTHKHNH